MLLHEWRRAGLLQGAGLLQEELLAWRWATLATLRGTQLDNYAKKALPVSQSMDPNLSKVIE